MRIAMIAKVADEPWGGGTDDAAPGRTPCEHRSLPPAPFSFGAGSDNPPMCAKLFESLVGVAQPSSRIAGLDDHPLSILVRAS